MGDVYANGIEANAFIDQIHIGALYVDKKEKITDSFPSMENNVLEEMQGYKWENWDIPVYEERLKQSYYLVKDLFSKD